MRIKLFENFKKSLVEQKCDLLDELTLPLKDLGLYVSIHKKRVLVDGHYYGNYNSDGSSKSITLIIKDDNRILNKGVFDYNRNMINDDVIQDFILDLKAFGMNPRDMVGSDKLVCMTFDKWGKMTNSEVLKKNEDFKNDERKCWRLTDEMKSKIDSEINNVLIELTDNGFEIEIDHFAKKISGDNSILVSVHKINNNERFNTDEVKDNIEVLLAYMNENYGVKQYDYNVEMMGQTSVRNITKEYPTNLEVIEIDVDIII